VIITALFPTIKKRNQSALLLAWLGLILLQSPVAAWSAATEEDDSKQKASADFVVSGEDKLKVRSEKILRDLFVDMDKPFQELMVKFSKSAQKILPDKYLETNDRASMMSSSHMTFSPWLMLITKQPILVIRSPQLSMEIKKWKFQISDEAGQVLYQQDGGSSLPESFSWDGRCRNGRLIDVGESYFYSITLIDKGDNPLVTTSKPRKLSSLAFYQSNNLNIRILSAVLFDDKIRSRFSSVGTSLMKETCDYLIKDIGRTTQITVTASDLSLGQAQGDKVKEFIVEQLALPAEDVKVVVNPSANPLTDNVAVQCMH
jgi:hypothetical protein